MSPVTGKMLIMDTLVYCQSIRRSDESTRCGPTARYFEAKEVAGA
jgi:hypothetical protein